MISGNTVLTPCNGNKSKHMEIYPYIAPTALSATILITNNFFSSEEEDPTNNASILSAF